MIEGVTPPAPKIKADLFLKSKLEFCIANSKPTMSVLSPHIFSFFLKIVFTE